jgi:hypothetical protein
MSFDRMFDHILREIASHVPNVDLGRVLPPLNINKDSWNSLSHLPQLTYFLKKSIQGLPHPMEGMNIQWSPHG